MDLLAEQGIWMQLDAHQDQWHETYGGEGVPDWAMIRPAPFNLLPPINLPFPLGYWTPETSTVFDQFWANKHGLLDGWVAAWEVAARWWRDQPYLMGYDLINEPWMGLEWPTCLLAGCQASYTDELQPAYEKATAAIRAIDHREHRLVGAAAVRRRAEDPDLPRADGRGAEARTFLAQLLPGRLPGVAGRPAAATSRTAGPSAATATEHALDQAATMHAVPLMSEWGATDNLRAIEIDAAVADENLMGWLHWAYKRWDDPTTADDAQGMFADDADLTPSRRTKLRQLVRTYAQAVAGVPTAMSFDAATGLSGSATDRTPRSPRRPRSSSARCTTRTATGCGSRAAPPPGSRAGWCTSHPRPTPR